MSGHIIGSPEDKIAWANQMRALHTLEPSVLVVGRFGRAAIMASYGYDFPPLPLREPAPAGNEAFAVLRDIDIIGLTYEAVIDDEELRPAYHPHPIDAELTSYIDRTSNPKVLQLRAMLSRPDEDFIGRRTADKTMPYSALASAELLTPRERLLDGVPIRTPLIGVQQWIERVVGVSARTSPEEQAKYDRNRAAFDTFAERMRTIAPDEFLPHNVMAPLVDLALHSNA